MFLHRAVALTCILVAAVAALGQPALQPGASRSAPGAACQPASQSAFQGTSQPSLQATSQPTSQDVQSTADTPLNPDPKHLPMHRIRLPGIPTIHSATFSQDGNTLYVLVDGKAINIWAILVYYWPELLGTLAGLTALVCLPALRRIAKRPRLVGEPHCRKCNYCLKGCPSDRCPECGWRIKRPIIGRPTWRRCVPWLVPLALILALNGVMWAFRVSRTGEMAKWCNWWSYDLETWAANHNVSLATWVQNVDRVLELDVQSGQLHGTLITRLSGVRPRFQIATAPDGRAMIIPLTDGDRLALVSTFSGSVLRTLVRINPSSGGTTEWTQLAGFDDSGHVAYVVAFDEPAKKSKLISWDLRSGRNSVVAEYEADELSYPDASPRRGKLIWPRRIVSVPGNGPAGFLEYGAAPNALGSLGKVLVRDRLDPSRLLGRFSVPEGAILTPGFAPDGRHAFFIAPMSQPPGIVGFDVETGEVGRFAPVPPGWTLGLTEALADCHAGRLFVSAESASRMQFGGAAPSDQLPMVFLVFDLLNDRAVGWFVRPANGSWSHVRTASPHGRFLAVVEYLRGVVNNQAAQQEISIYDLSTLPHGFPN